MRYYRLVGGVILSCATLMGIAQEPYPVAASTSPIVKAEYFFDTDPGLGNGSSVVITPGMDINGLARTLMLTGSGLSNGLHYFYLRTQNANGKWSLNNARYFDNMFVPMYPVEEVAPNLAGAEYFIDTDPGPGNGTPIALPGAELVDGFHVAVDITGLSPAVHRLYVRTKDAGGRWSLRSYAVFDNSVTVPYPTAPAVAPAVALVEYYIDHDPGFGNGKPISVGASNDVSNFMFSVPLAGVTQGNHTFYLRSRQNPWSMSAYADFAYAISLPVHWLFVKGEAASSGSRITWATGEEQQADNFIVEYSTDGIQFSKAGVVKAANRANGSSYSFFHEHRLSGTLYYRIKQTDVNGDFTYSKIIILLFRNQLNSYVLFPNPVKDILNVAVPRDESVLKMAIYSSDGRLVQQVNVNGVDNVISVQVSQLQQGSYYLKIEGKTTIKTLPFLKP
ncbi:T9SS type A sorting domain-containing protein [Paraflavitalea sp. CAU 1676]|uniref:T9SS type A sorting domain-containing protein n=1 Tax=Paraflavitalea sp. CAU 1676 TaxID=3032598 RepID=UPI0023DA693F|nr:T9SS type A sorting domain-containing protein [Paraflavitalea sp. CAU 1676]MDF2193549.1 T9SS type A sorting domain-containing protein [Paraflavitalea sp. CAU 1676]